MSLDVYLISEKPGTATRRAIFVREDGVTKEISREEWDRRNPGVEPVTVPVNDAYEYEANITHNLARMAKFADLYDCLWDPGALGITHAQQLVEPILEGLQVLTQCPDQCRSFNPENGWGTYETLLDFTLNYLRACALHPEARVVVSR